MTNEVQGYKYWLSFEARNLTTDQSLTKNVSIFYSHRIQEEDLSVIKDQLKMDLVQSCAEIGLHHEFEINFNCWPHLLGRMDAPSRPEPKETIKRPVRQTPTLKIVH